jgi:hypothetical protein
MARRPLDPRICSVAIDVNALTRGGSDHDGLVDRLLWLSAAGTINLIAPKGMSGETLDPRTPDHFQEAALPKIFTIQVALNSDEQRRRRLIEEALQGNGRFGQHAADADHLFETAKYCSYFITHDRRILDRVGKIRSLLPPSLTVVTLPHFLAIFDKYEARRQRAAVRQA